MSLKLQLPKLIDVKPRLTVIGVGGAGCNAVNNMIAAGLQGVDFVVANTDAQSLAASSAEHRIQLGAALTEGLGAGAKPEIGEAAAQEAIDEIRAHIAGSHMVFVAAGMGGGTGTGAAAVIARASRELGILTVGIVTKPFQFEGAHRMRMAEAGVQSLRQHVDTLIVIPNQNLFRVANERTTFAEAFVLADQVLYSGVACIVDLVLKEGLINLDFADVRTVMSGMGTAMMGTGEASGERRAVLAAEEAIANPLLDDVSLKGARGLLLSITGGQDLTLYEVDEAASRVREEVDPDCNIIVGATFDQQLGDRVRVSIVASGMKRHGEAVQQPVQSQPQQQAAIKNSMPSLQSPPVQQRQPAPNQPAPHNEDDIQRRLYEALQQPQHQQQPQQQQPAAMGHYPPSQPYMPPQQPQHDPRQREVVRHGPVNLGPGNVMIEEGFSPFLQGGARPQSNARPQQQAHQAPAQGFEPQAPVDVRRQSRRIPGVEEFPEVAQREWQAKHPAGNPGASNTEEGRRKGLFGRLAGLGRKPQETAHAQNQGPNPELTDDVPLPIFFGRERR